ncbi:MAG: YihA family ribosome biogenesis GTP-binding protein [Rubrivivax sp.]|nr:MAG: YihA family ribosome biogenesis GTP-binding protein [Rubrivivax sp.]
MTPGKRALAWTHTARFLTTASQLKHLPVNGVLPADAQARAEAEAALAGAEAAGFDEIDEVDDDLLDDADVGAPEVDSGSGSVAEGEALAQDLAPRRLPEIAFVGRSNAGKSTAVNTLAQQKRLAFASKTPGRTQHINLFAVGPRDAPDALFADLPGYGYAAVARDAKLRWQRVMADYLGQRESLSGVVLMVDSRLGLTDLDKQLLEFVSDRVTAGEVSLLVVLTKADKLNRKEGAAILAQVQEDLGVLATEDSDIGVTLFSALSKQGLEDVAEVIYDWAHAEPRTPDGDEEDDDAASDHTASIDDEADQT